MPNPSSAFAWRYPAEGADPWYTAFAATYSHMALSVRSVELLNTPRATVVISLVPAGALLGCPTSGAYAASFAILATGSFSVQRSGSTVVFHLAGATYRFATLQSFGARLDVGWQLVVNAGSVMVTSAMEQPLYSSAIYEPFAATCVASLAPGNFSATLQVAVRPWGVDSQALFDTKESISLVAFETTRLP